MSYNASAVKIYNAKCVLKTRNIFLCFKNALAYYSADVIVVNFEVAGLGQG
jgi:hypothetical protein